jgi:undecaprenyl-diphosphatase
MDFTDALIFGIVEGVTEFLPISSTGHLILTGKLLGTPASEFLKSFEIAIQLGAILAVVVLYWRALLVEWEVMKRIAVAFLPTAVLGFLLYRQVKSMLDSEQVVLWSLLVGGVVLIAFEYLHGEKPGASEGLTSFGYGKAFLIGVFQALAFIPGVSRAGATVIGGLALGIRRRTIVEFSFVLAVPTMAAATGYDMLRTAASFNAHEAQLLAVGFVTSFVVAILAVRLLLRFVTLHTFVAFGVYRILAACLGWAVGVGR